MTAAVIGQPGVQRRFLAKVETPAGVTGCWLWTGAKSANGYGQLRVGGRVAYAHRLALEAKIGRPLRKGEFALHNCDNPPCVNPAHLYAGDQTDNMRDCARRRRLNTDGLALGRVAGKTLGQYRTGPELCGTRRGYDRHRRHGERTCAACRTAANEYNLIKKAARA